MSKIKGKVLLIVGPGGSGKSTLAKYTAERLGWNFVEEDQYWAKAKFDTSNRTPEQESAVQAEVFTDIISMVETGTNIVLEFILYKAPPNPLTAYTNLLDKKSVDSTVVALGPNKDKIIERMKIRGRESDMNNLEERQKNIEHQLNCLNTVRKEWIIDSSDTSLEELYEYCLKRLNQKSSKAS
jgi:adenylate kinase family enzyme